MPQSAKKTILTFNRVLFVALIIFVVAAIASYAINFKVADTQILVDGNMEAADTSAWTIINNGIMTKETADPPSGARNMRIEINTGKTHATVYQYPVLTIGTIYKFLGWYRTDGTAVAQIKYQSSPTNLLPTSPTEWTYFEHIVTAGYEYAALQVSGTAGNWVEFDDVFITEYTPPVQQSTLFKGLIGWWPLKDSYMQSATVVSDKTPYANHGTINGTVTVGSDETTFGGTDDTDYINTGQSSKTFSALSISAWVKPASISADYHAIVSKGIASSIGCPFVLTRHTNDLYFFVRHADDSDYGWIRINNQLVADNWYHAVATFDGATTAKLYLNGQDLGSDSAPLDGIYNGGHEIWIGEYDQVAAGSGAWDGDMKDVMIWNRALTPAEVTQLYNTKF